VAIDTKLVNKRLAIIMREVEFLKTVRIPDYERFIADGKALRATARSFELIAQSVVDVASHIIAQRRLGIPDSYRDMITVLEQNSILDSRLSKSLQNMISMRNLLVHQYLEVDYELVFEAIPSAIADANEFVSGIRQLLKD